MNNKSINETLKNIENKIINKTYTNPKTILDEIEYIYNFNNITNEAIQFRLKKCLEKILTQIIKEKIKDQDFKNAWKIHDDACLKYGEEVVKILTKIIEQKYSEYIYNIKKSLETKDISETFNFLEKIKSKISEKEYIEIYSETIKKEKNAYENKIRNYTQKHDFKNAYQTFLNIPQQIKTNEVQRYLLNHIMGQQKLLIETYLDEDFDTAQEKTLNLINDTPFESKKDELIEYFKNNKEYYEIKDKITRYLLTENFDDADIYYQNFTDILSENEYITELKLPYIKKQSIKICELLSQDNLIEATRQIEIIQQHNLKTKYKIEFQQELLNHIIEFNNKNITKYLEIISKELSESILKTNILNIFTLLQLLNNFDFNLSDEFINNISDIIPNNKYEELKTQQINKCIQEINEKISNEDYNTAYQYTLKLQDKNNIDTFIEEIEKNIDKKIKTMFNLKKIEPLEDFIQFIPKTYHKKITNLYTLLNLLENKKFLEADKFFSNNKNILMQKEYLEAKSKSMQEYFTSINIEINKEQALSISNTAQNVLITARAGSGKTRTIACRAILALEKEQIKPENLILLSFNKAAANEMRERINKEFKYSNFNNRSARTFHSLAWGIVNPQEEILRDDSDNFIEQKLTNFVSKLYTTNEELKKEFQELIYLYYKNGNENSENISELQNMTAEEKYEFLRGKQEITLNGEKVKSNGEKWIADFLFEHDIKYKYEEILTCKKSNNNHKIYHPDFTIYNKEKNLKYILEHWGIDETDETKTVPKHWTKKWDEYINEMNWKRKICQEKNVILIETSIKDIPKKNSRKNFETTLKTKLEKVGILCKKLPIEIIYKKIQNKHKDSLAQKFAKFILYAQKRKITPEQLNKELKKEIYKNNKRDFTFLTMVNKIYQMYDDKLLKENKTDDDHILLRATNKILETKGNCKILLGDKSVKIKNIQFILIDEFQDTSTLFIDMIQAIIKFNPTLKLFCVGDNWQAINGFNASDLYYFNNFDKIFKNTGNNNLSYNYRSGQNIINAGNTLMEKIDNENNQPAKCKNKELKDIIHFSTIDSVNIFREHNEIDSNYIYDKEIDLFSDLINSTPQNHFFGINHRYFKKCCEIISQKPNKSYIIMHRTNKINNYFELELFEKKLKERFENTNIKAGTIHKFKGLEADIAIILECNNGVYPMIHPDTTLYNILGRTSKDILQEERRLFYVALTRGKEEVYCLYSNEKVSDYIDEINPDRQIEKLYLKIINDSEYLKYLEP